MSLERAELKVHSGKTAFTVTLLRLMPFPVTNNANLVRASAEPTVQRKIIAP